MRLHCKSTLILKADQLSQYFGLELKLFKFAAASNLTPRLGAEATSGPKPHQRVDWGNAHSMAWSNHYKDR